MTTKVFRKDDTALRKKLKAALAKKKVFADALSDANKLFSEKVKEMSILRRIGDSISSSLDEKTVCKSLLSILISEMTAENCSIMLLSEDGKSLLLKAAAGQTDSTPRYFTDEEAMKMKKMKIGEGAAGWVAKTGKPLLIKNVAKNKKFRKLSGGLKNISSLLCMPIMGRDGFVGLLNLSHPNVGEFSEEDARLFRLIVNQAALAFSNIRFFTKVKKLNEELEQRVEARTKELSDTEQKRKTLMKFGSDAILIACAKTGKIFDCNNNALKLAGIPLKKCSRFKIHDFFPSDQKQLVVKMLKLVKERKKVLVQDSFLKHRSKKKKIPVSVSCSVIELADGPVLYIAARDITHRVLLDQKMKDYSSRLEQEVKKRTRELQQAQNQFIQAGRLTALGELASGMAHEINNPVAIIRGYAEDLRERMKKGEQLNRDLYIETLDTIIGSADRCHIMTDEILNFAKPRPNKIGRYSIKDIVGSAVKMARNRIRKTGIKVTIDATRIKTQINTDKGHLEHVFINLLNNAADVTPKNGKIDVKLVKRKDLVIISVIDYGKGISKENLPKIFDPFFTTKEPGKGTGLGLSSSYRIVSKLGGNITVNSRRGKTIFKVILPAGSQKEEIVHA